MEIKKKIAGTWVISEIFISFELMLQRHETEKGFRSERVIRIELRITIGSIRHYELDFCLNI